MTRDISPLQAYEWLKSGEAVLIDVREADEFSAEHIAYAAHLPLGLVKDMMARMSIPKERKVLFQCRRGARGEQACALIEASSVPAGIFNIEGGIDGWKAAGLPVIGKGGPKVSIFRQVQMIIGTALFALILMGLAGIGFALILAAVLAFVFAFTGVIGWCGLAILLQKAPWNK